MVVNRQEASQRALRGASQWLIRTGFHHHNHTFSERLALLGGMAVAAGAVSAALALVADAVVTGGVSNVVLASFTGTQPDAHAHHGAVSRAMREKSRFRAL
jgi:hypothetical protein